MPTKQKAVDVYNAGGEYVRTYSDERHGKDFEELAESFVSRRPEFKIAESKRAGSDGEK